MFFKSRRDGDLRLKYLYFKALSSLDGLEKKGLRGKFYMAFILAVLGLATSAIVAGVLGHFDGYGWKYSLDKLVFDFNAMAYRNVPPQRVHAAFTLLDIDERTYKEWRKPSMVPRDRLADLLKIAVDGKAGVVILDFRLSERTQQDDVLKEYLASLQDASGPPVFLVREFGPRQGDGRCLEAEPTPYDGAVEHSPQVFWTSARLSGSDNRVLHRARLWERACISRAGERAGGDALIPSVFLAVAAFVPRPEGAAHADAPAVMRRLTDGLDSALNCAGRGTAHCGPTGAHGHPPELHLGNARVISLDQGPYTVDSLIKFTLPWTVRGGESRASDRLSGDPILARIPAHILTQEGVSVGDTLRGRIVVIGSSHEDSGDMRVTPLGLMPGGYALINALHSLVNLEPLKHLDHLAALLIIELPIVLLASLLIVFLPQTSLSSTFATALLVIIFIVVIPAVGIYYWGGGIWVDLLAPSISAFLHHKLIHRIRHAHAGTGRLAARLPLHAPHEGEVPGRVASKQKEPVE